MFADVTILYNQNLMLFKTFIQCVIKIEAMKICLVVCGGLCILGERSVYWRLQIKGQLQCQNKLCS